MTGSAVVLLSGGLDSTTTLAIAKAEGFCLHALTFRYGQRHEVELDAARRVGEVFGVVEHSVVDIDLRQIGGSSLTSDIPVPHHPAPLGADAIEHAQNADRADASAGTAIPVTYVPARNTIFLSVALALAEVRGASDIFLGVNALDYSGYPDCRPEYLAAFEHMANLATKATVQEGRAIRIRAPLVSMSKAQIIATGLELGVDYSLTHSCYDPVDKGRPCGTCDSCILRRKGFAELGIPDPLGSG